jgi:hypothetical protein
MIYFWGDRDNVHLFLIYFLVFEVRLMCGRVASFKKRRGSETFPD